MFGAADYLSWHNVIIFIGMFINVVSAVSLHKDKIVSINGMWDKHSSSDIVLRSR